MKNHKRRTPLTLYDLIVDALNEAVILEAGRGVYDRDNIIYTAMRLSGAPYSFTEEVAERIRV